MGTASKLAQLFGPCYLWDVLGHLAASARRGRTRHHRSARRGLPLGNVVLAAISLLRGILGARQLWLGGRRSAERALAAVRGLDPIDQERMSRRGQVTIPRAASALPYFRSVAVCLVPVGRMNPASSIYQASLIDTYIGEASLVRKVCRLSGVVGRFAEHIIGFCSAGAALSSRTHRLPVKHSNLEHYKTLWHGNARKFTFMLLTLVS